MAYSTLRLERLICSDRAIFAAKSAHCLWRSDARKARKYGTFDGLMYLSLTSRLPSQHGPGLRFKRRHLPICMNVCRIEYDINKWKSIFLPHWSILRICLRGFDNMGKTCDETIEKIRTAWFQYVKQFNMHYMFDLADIYNSIERDVFYDNCTRIDW